MFAVLRYFVFSALIFSLFACKNNSTNPSTPANIKIESFAHPGQDFDIDGFNVPGFSAERVLGSDEEDDLTSKSCGIPNPEAEGLPGEQEEILAHTYLQGGDTTRYVKSDTQYTVASDTRSQLYVDIDILEAGAYDFPGPVYASNRGKGSLFGIDTSSTHSGPSINKAFYTYMSPIWEKICKYNFSESAEDSNCTIGTYTTGNVKGARAILCKTREQLTATCPTQPSNRSGTRDEIQLKVLDKAWVQNGCLALQLSIYQVPGSFAEYYQFSTGLPMRAK